MELKMVSTGFYTGVAAGLLVSLITFFIAKLLPWVHNVLSKEAKLPAKWQWFDDTDKEPIGTLTIKQTGNIVKGELIRNTSTGGEKKQRRFILTGKLYCDKLIALYKEPGNPRLVSGALVLKLRSNREHFYGRTLYLKHDSGNVVAPKFIFSTSEELPELGEKYLGLDKQKTSLETSNNNPKPKK